MGSKFEVKFILKLGYFIPGKFKVKFTLLYPHQRRYLRVDDVVRDSQLIITLKKRPLKSGAKVHTTWAMCHHQNTHQIASLHLDVTYLLYIVDYSLQI